MKLEEVTGHVLDLPKKQRKAVVRLIDIASEENMDKILSKLDSMQAQLDAMKWLYLATISLCGFMVAGLGVFLKFYPG